MNNENLHGSVIQGSLEVLNSMQITAGLEGMDQSSKELFKNKEVLAIILKGAAREFEGCSYEEIMDLIEADSITSREEVSPGRTNTRIIGEDKEYIALNEKMSVFDTKFRVLNPELSKGEVVVNLHMDVEPQKNYSPGYPIEKRGIYYLARELSAQLSLAKDNTDYGVLEKCYSIWICRDNVPEDEKFSISFIEMSNTKNYGKCRPLRKNYDLLTLVVIRLGDQIYRGLEDKNMDDMLSFLHTIMYPHKKDFMEKVKKYIDFSQNEELWKEAVNMSGLGLSILEEGFAEGLAKGIVMLGMDLGLSVDEIIEKLQDKMDITLEEAKEYVRMFGEQGSMES